MNIAKQYQEAITKQQIEHMNIMHEMEATRVENDALKPDFSDYCTQITTAHAGRLLHKVYKARVQAGLPAFTHPYEYPLTQTCWLAHRDFICLGRYGADSIDIVFVPKGITVKAIDHTTVIYTDDWQRNGIVPAYSNVVQKEVNAYGDK